MEQYDGVWGFIQTQEIWPSPLYPSACEWIVTVEWSTIPYNPPASSYILQPVFHHLGYNPSIEAWWCAHAYWGKFVLIWAVFGGDNDERWLYFHVLSYCALFWEAFLYQAMIIWIERMKRYIISIPTINKNQEEKSPTAEDDETLMKCGLVKVRHSGSKLCLSLCLLFQLTFFFTSEDQIPPQFLLWSPGICRCFTVCRRRAVQPG